MSIMRCIHCDTNFDSDFKDYCPRCNNTDEHFEHPELQHGEECPYCGDEVVKDEVVAEMQAAKREWDLMQIIRKTSFQEEE